ncbi:MAG: L-2-hydroxyglutarate oxidase [Opitutae bacterium]|jgi:(S)-2-hydroxyglutarate dehydrogenase|nr:L-2-hydroxyglutarate oxidase [Opitutae bacterium]
MGKSRSTDQAILKTDICIIGGGIVGLATAYRLLKSHPGKRVVIVEKEASLAKHQTGHNSGVLHSGIYYKPGSLKAVNCRKGKLAMEDFCKEHGIEHELCGKIIVALNEEEIPRMEKIYQRGKDNDVKCEIISRERMLEIEPHAAGIQAIHVPECGIVNYRQVCERMGEWIGQTGANEVLLGRKALEINERGESLVIRTDREEIESEFLVNCAGLHSDRVTRLSGQPVPAKIVPFKGEYYELTKEAKHLCKHLIYPVPDPQFPFLGVHFTRMIDGAVECGPNAVLAFGREAYGKLDFNLKDLIESLGYPGFGKMALKHWKMGLGEMWRSYNKGAFVRALQRLIPEIEAKHLERAPAGIRAQAVTRDGSMVDDFLIQESNRVVNVCNAPSPAATASLNIGETIASKLAERF